MPGHKGIDLYNIGDIFKYDVTEIEGMDNLLNSNGVIKETEELYSKVYGSVKSAISTQGSTLGVQMMLTMVVLAANADSKKIITDRNIHVSAINTMALLNVDPVWIYPDIHLNKFMPGIISAQNVEQKIIENIDAIAVYITSPNYFGVIANVKAIAEVCKKYNKFLLVDNAHGAHLNFIASNLHPISCGASACCDSLHKTLPVLTGGGLVHVMDSRLVPYINKARCLYSSTSPSYLTMLSIDILLNYIYGNLVNDLKLLLQKVQQLSILAQDIGLAVPTGELDPVKFVIGPGRFNCSSLKLAEIFRKFKIEPEYVSEYWLVFIFSTQNSNKDFDRCKSALNYIKINMSENFCCKVKNYFGDVVKLNKGLTIKEAVFGKSVKIKTEDSLGRVAAMAVTVCPPAIPIIIPGEVISQEVIDVLLSKKINFLEVIV